MSHKRERVTKEYFFFVEPTAKCSKPEFRTVLPDYLSGTLPIMESRAFRKHMFECVECAVDVGNWKDSKAAEEYYRLHPKNPKLH